MYAKTKIIFPNSKEAANDIFFCQGIISCLVGFRTREEKDRILAKALEEHNKIHELPVRLTTGSTWLLDEKASGSFILTNLQNHHKTRIMIA